MGEYILMKAGVPFAEIQKMPDKWREMRRTVYTFMEKLDMSKGVGLFGL